MKLSLNKAKIYIGHHLASVVLVSENLGGSSTLTI